MLAYFRAVFGNQIKPSRYYIKISRVLNNLQIKRLIYLYSWTLRIYVKKSFCYMLQVSHKAIKKWICYKKKSYFIFNSLWTLSTTSTSQAKKMIHATLSHFRVRTQWLEWNKMIRIQTRLTTFCMFLCTSHAACHFSYSSVPFFFFLFAPFLLLLFALENYTLISKCLLLTRSVHTTLRVPCPEACIPFPVCIAPTVFLASPPISLSPFRFSLSLSHKME